MMESSGVNETSSRGAELSIKPEFLVKAERTVTDRKTEDVQANDGNNDKSDEGAKAKREKKNKGRNKNRPPPMKFDRQDRVCPSLVNVSEDENLPSCQHPNCSFKHDLGSWMSKKPDDLGDTCCVYEAYGRCRMGVACRFGKGHIVVSEDPEGKTVVKNKVDLGKWAAHKDVKQELNHLPTDLKIDLRKKKVDFEDCDSLVDRLFKEREEKGKGKDVIERESGDVEAKKARLDIVEDPVTIYNDREKKGIDWKDKLYLAPLTTVGNLPFRRLCKGLGADITCGEMSVGLQLLQGHQPEWALVQRHRTEDIFGIQVCGSSPHQMTRLARVVEDHIDCDFVDINSGCPIDLIYKRGMGCGLMGRKKPLEVLCRAMSSVLSVPLTVKMRTGIYMDKKIAHTLIPSVKEWGVDMITLHGRSREQRYYRLADWDYIGECAKVADPLPLFGNGDIINFEDYYSHKETAGVAGIMFARGALIKPWVFTEVKEKRHWDISASERLDMIRSYAEYGLEHWGSDSKGVETTRRFLLEWLSFLHRYVPHGILERPPQRMNERIPRFVGRNELETLLASPNCADWVRVSEMFLGKVPDGFAFEAKHRAHGYN